MKKIILIAILTNPLFVLAQNFEWVTGIQGASLLNARNISTDLNGNIVVSGDFAGTIDFDPGLGVNNITTAGGIDFFVQKLDSNGNLIWAFTIGATGNEDALGMEVDNSGNVYVTGHFENTVDFDPGPGVFNLTSNGLNDIFIVKINLSGNLVWAKSIGAGGNDYGYDLKVDTNNYLYVVGNFTNTVDFDPGPGITNAASNGVSDAFALKMDTAGIFIWAKTFGGLDNCYSEAVVIGKHNDIFLTGNYKGSVDFDPGIGTNVIMSFGNTDSYLLRLDTAGIFIWSGSIGGANIEDGEDLCTDASGNIFVTGSYEFGADLDLGPDTVYANNRGDKDIYIMKIDTSGNLIWVNTYGSFGADRGISIYCDEFDNIILGGLFSGQVDFDHSMGISNLNSGGGTDIIILKLNNQGDELWGINIGDTGNDGAQSITSDLNDNIIVSGHFYFTPDFNPGIGIDTMTANAIYDGFVLKLSNDSCASFSTLVDSLVDVSCSDSGRVFTSSINGFPPYNYSWNIIPASFDSIASTLIGGLHTVTVTDANGCVDSSSVILNAPGSISGFDMNVNMIATSFRTGFSASIWLDAFNNGCLPTSGQVILVLDTQLTYDSSSVVPNLINGDTLIWNYNTMTNDSSSFNPQIFFTTSIFAMIGDSICFDLTITPSIGDVDTSNNNKQYCFEVINGYDPNDKQVYPVGYCSDNLISIDQKLTYTIRFQNTGNADAINIYVLDSISPFLDINSVNIVSQSHNPLITEVLTGNVLQFRFDSIQLPDSSSNLIGSNGYVVFEITPFPGLPSGTVINNKSEIYFDFNPAVVTNAVSNSTYDCGLFNMGLNTGSLNICQGDTISVFSNNNQPCTNYSWSIDDFSFGLDSTFSWVADTSGAFSLNLNNSNGVCNRDTNVTVVVSICTGIDVLSTDNEIIIYPNPANNQLAIESETKVETMEIIDVSGRILISYNHIVKLIDISMLSKGVYFLKLKTEAGITIRKFVKQ